MPPEGRPPEAKAEADRFWPVASADRRRRRRVETPARRVGIKKGGSRRATLSKGAIDCRRFLRSLVPAPAEQTQAHERDTEKRERRWLGNDANGGKFFTARYRRALRAAGTGQRE